MIDIGMTNKDMINKLCIIGVGLIGSSLSLALKREAAVGEVIGYGRNQANLEKGMELGVLDRYETTIAAAVEGADVIVVAVPLGAMQAVFAEIAKTARDDALITDVGSAKGSVVQAALAEFGDSVSRFVPGHPIAGGEQSGVEAGYATLYQGRRVILTPLAQTDAAASARIEAMWRKCGADIECLDVEHHDKVLAATSHLPHMLAYALVHQLSNLNDHEEIFRYAAGGFRDFTRIASSDPVMWRDVCIANGEALVDLIEQYQHELNSIAEAIKTADADELLRLFSHAKSQRDLQIGSC
jgi:prephenate dehydrogenase